MFNLKKLFRSFYHAISGLQYLLYYEQNFRIHLLSAIIVLILALVLSVSHLEILILLLTISFVLMAEIVNTVIEKILDLLHPTYHEKVKIIKDATAGIVLFAAMVSIIIALFIFIPKFSVHI